MNAPAATALDSQLLPGKPHADAIAAESRAETERLAARGIVPGLSVVLVGDDPASTVYVRNKGLAAEKAGLRAETIRLPAETPLAEIEATIDRLNGRDDVDGILLQLPLPRPGEANALLSRIDPKKDVDGFHPENVGLLHSGRPRLVPCTPAGVIEMLRREKVAMRGANAVVVGRSNIVGRPMSALLLAEDATVTVCHSRTVNLAEVTRRADLLVVAMGRPGSIGPEHVKDGAIVVDVGMNAVTKREDVERFFPGDEKRRKTFDEKGQTLIGDVDFVRVLSKAGRLTPVPGGVGLLTVAMLIRNTLRAAKLRRGLPE